MKHTPGPWVAIEVKGRTIISSQAGDRVGECESLSKQDVALIAAAPNLLAALRAAADALEASIARSLPPKQAHLAAQSPDVVDARAAIAKAEGA